MQIILTVDFSSHDMNEDWVRRLGHYLEKSVVASVCGTVVSVGNAHGDQCLPFSVAHVVIAKPTGTGV